METTASHGDGCKLSRTLRGAAAREMAYATLEMPNKENATEGAIKSSLSVDLIRRSRKAESAPTPGADGAEDERPNNPTRRFDRPSPGGTTEQSLADSGKLHDSEL